jgi:hypothetical protein
MFSSQARGVALPSKRLAQQQSHETGQQQQMSHGQDFGQHSGQQQQLAA